LHEPSPSDGWTSGLPRASALRIAAGLFAVVLLPDVFLYVGVATSGALGTAIVALIFLLCSLPMFSRWRQPFSDIERRRTVSIGVLALCVMAFITAHAVVAAVLLPFDGVHALASAVLLAVMIMAGGAFADLIMAADAHDVDRVMRWCLLAMGAMVVEGIFGLSPPTAFVSPKPMFPFTEPSHFALTCAPFLLFCAVRARGVPRVALLVVGAAAALMLQNFTFLIAVGLTAAVCLRRSVAVVMVFIVVAVASQLDLTYYSSRLDFSQDNANLSTLVYLQGWQLIFESLKNSSGWGLGFQQLGIHGTSVEASDLIYSMVGGYGNILDGGFTFAKIVSEFGVLGLLLIVAYWVLAFGALKQLRVAARAEVAMDASKVFAAAIILCYWIELFVRGAGYFTGTSIMLVAACRIWSLAPKAPPLGAIASLAVR
jgi:hypothetical protein